MITCIGQNPNNFTARRTPKVGKFEYDLGGFEAQDRLQNMAKDSILQT